MTIAILFSGAIALSASAGRASAASGLPDYRRVRSSLPGASPETMASAVATPLERQFGRIAGGHADDVVELSLAHQHHAAIRSESRHQCGGARRASRPSMPRAANCRPTFPASRAIARSIRPTRRSCFCRSPPITSRGRHIYDAADSILAQKLAQIQGVGQVFTWGASEPAGARAGESAAAKQLWDQPGEGAQSAAVRQFEPAKGSISNVDRDVGTFRYRSTFQGIRIRATDRSRARPARRCGWRTSPK